MDNLCSFYTDDGAKLEITGLEDVSKIHVCEWPEIIFKIKGKSYVIYNNDEICYAIDSFIGSLRGVIDNKLELHKSIVGKDVGFLIGDYYNLCSSDEKVNEADYGFVMKKSKSGESNYWVGEGYEVWGAKEDFIPFLYNENNKIIFQISTHYHWHFLGPEYTDKIKDYVPYEEFRKNRYKIIYKNEISPKTAKQWLAQCEELRKRMYFN